jgi:hypothetical protein
VKALSTDLTMDRVIMVRLDTVTNGEFSAPGIGNLHNASLAANLSF